MKKLVLFFIMMAFFTQISMAEDYLLDASAMSVGATAGENLIVKEGCLNTSQTDCNEKVKWLTAPFTKIGTLEINGLFTGDFEVSLTINVNNGGNKGISLMTEDNNGIEYNILWDSGYGGVLSDAWFFPKGIGSGGGSNIEIRGWNAKPAFNEINLNVQKGIARVHVNGTESVNTPITLDTNTVFKRLLITGITSDDRLSEVKIKGLKTCGNSCEGIYTQQQVDAMISNILLWGDIDGDKKISLSEAIHALQVTSGLKNSK